MLQVLSLLKRNAEEQYSHAIWHTQVVNRLIKKREGSLRN